MLARGCGFSIDFRRQLVLGCLCRMFLRVDATIRYWDERIQVWHRRLWQRQKLDRSGQHVCQEDSAPASGVGPQNKLACPIAERQVTPFANHDTQHVDGADVIGGCGRCRGTQHQPFGGVTVQIGKENLRLRERGCGSRLFLLPLGDSCPSVRQRFVRHDNWRFCQGLQGRCCWNVQANLLLYERPNPANQTRLFRLAKRNWSAAACPTSMIVRPACACGSARLASISAIMASATASSSRLARGWSVVACRCAA